MNDVYSEQLKGCTLEIVQDKEASSPDYWGDSGVFLVADHRDFYVKYGEEKPEATLSRIQDAKTHWIFGLEAYIHSGVSLALSHEGNFPDRQWDVSQLGAVFVSKKEWRTQKKAREVAQRLIETWNDYLSGNVYGYIIKDERGEHLDSCWGFIGDYNKSGILDEAREVLSHHAAAKEIAKRKAEQKAQDIAAAENLLKPYGLTVSA